MDVLNLIERAEKNHLIGRFDKKSAINFINDALYEISKRQALFVTEEIKNLKESPIVLKGTLIKLQSVKFKSGDFRIQISPNGVIHVSKKKDEFEREWELLKEEHGIEVDVDVTYIGYIPVVNLEGEDSEVLLPPYFQTAIVYYLQAKMLEERGSLEQALYFLNQYQREFTMKPSPKRSVVSQPSGYSLL